MHPTLFRTILIAILGFITTLSQAASPTQENYVRKLSHQWAEIRYHLENDKREERFEKLKDYAKSLTDQHPDNADLWVWSGIISSTYAGEAGGFSALSAVNDAKASFERSIDIDPKALDGSAYTSLGALYYQVPGWPLSFGDKNKAEVFLKKGLQENPNGIDANFFYADFLVTQGRYKEAEKYIKQAENASPRPNRAIADVGRRQELKKLRSTMNSLS